MPDTTALLEAWYGIVEWLDHWQSLVAGLLAFGAAIVAIRMILRRERREARRELDALKKTLGAEVRQFAQQAYLAHESCRKLAAGAGNFHISQVAEAGRFSEPVIYLNNAARIGLVGDEAHHVVLFFATIQAFRDAVARLRDYPTPQSIPPMHAAGPAETLLRACEAAVQLLPLLRSGNYYDKRDVLYCDWVAKARVSWDDLNNRRLAAE